MMDVVSQYEFSSNLSGVFSQPTQNNRFLAACLAIMGPLTTHPGDDPLTALRKILLDYIAYAEENPNEYRILFLSVETLGRLELGREDLQERNPAFGALFKCVETAIKAGVLQGEAFAVSTVLWTAAHGAASLLITAQKFPFSSRRLYAEEVVATILSGVQSRVITRI